MTKSTSSAKTHISVESATTLNRRYVQRPGALTDQPAPEKILESTKVTAVPTSPAITTAEQLHAAALKRRQALAEEMNRKNLANLRKQRLQKTSPAAKTIKKSTPRKLSITIPEEPQVSKAKAPAKATAPTVQLPVQPTPKPIATRSAQTSAPRQSLSKTLAHLEQETPVVPASKKPLQDSHRGRRFVKAFTAAVACVFLLGLVIKLNMPDLSVRVAALQTGIEAAYPSYIPNDYQLAGVSTEKDGSITIEFSGPDNANFSLKEEKSSWDSNALLNNYVKEAWGTDYTVVREQGITIYINGSDATWVNGGICYRLTAKSADALTKKQIKNIVTSL